MTFVPATLLSTFRSPLTMRTRHRAVQLLPRCAGVGAEFAAAAVRADRRPICGQYLACPAADYLRQPVFATLYDDLTEFVCRPGKRLRPLLFLLARPRVCRRRAWRPFGTWTRTCWRSAVSLELLHAFILSTTTSSTAPKPGAACRRCTALIESRLSTFQRPRIAPGAISRWCSATFSLPWRKDACWKPRCRRRRVARLGALLLGCMVETGFRRGGRYRPRHARRGEGQPRRDRADVPA